MSFTLRHLRLRRPLASIDLETTGTDPRADRVVEFAAVRFDTSGVMSGAYRTLVNPVMPIPPAATAVHGITDADVRDAPTFRQLAGHLARLLGDCDLAGFNVKGFDLPLLAAEFRRCGAALDLAGRAVLDAKEIFHAKERRDLTAAVSLYCGSPHGGAHRAADDAVAAAAVLDAQLGYYPDLPRGAAELHRRFSPVDVAGRFRLEGVTVVFNFGKHKGRALDEVARGDPGYLDWMLGQDFLPDVDALVRGALARVRDPGACPA